MKKLIAVLIGSLSISAMASNNYQFHVFNTQKPVQTDMPVVKEPANRKTNIELHPVIDATTSAWSFDRVREPEILPIIPEQPYYTVTQKAVEESVITDYTVSADLLFAFDSYKIKEKDKSTLNEIVDHMNNFYHEVEQLVVIGHTDRLGKDSYNKTLSENRANSVKNALVERGVNTDLITTFGAGEKEPVTDGCHNVKPYSAMKACLQPDRRVTIRVVGKALEKETVIKNVIE